MPLCLPIPKLTVPTASLSQRFASELLRRIANPEMDQDLRYIRELYDKINSEWDQVGERGKALYESTEPVLRELLLVLRSIADVSPNTKNAVHDFETAVSRASAGDYQTAIIYFSYALMKIHNQLEGLTNKSGSTKLGYGYDISGEAGGGRGGTSSNDRHLWDTGNSPKHDHTMQNPANMLVDADAESDYPELAKFKHKRVYWPPRTR